MATKAVQAIAKRDIADFAWVKGTAFSLACLIRGWQEPQEARG